MQNECFCKKLLFKKMRNNEKKVTEEKKSENVL